MQTSTKKGPAAVEKGITMLGAFRIWLIVCRLPWTTVGMAAKTRIPIFSICVRDAPEIMFVSSPAASMISWVTPSNRSPSMLATTLQMQASEKLSAREPRASPVIPMMPETSPKADSSVLTRGLPGTASMAAIFFRTSSVPVRKGLMYLTSMQSLRPGKWMRFPPGIDLPILYGVQPTCQAAARSLSTREAPVPAGPRRSAGRWRRRGPQAIGGSARAPRRRKRPSR